MVQRKYVAIQKRKKRLVLFVRFFIVIVLFGLWEIAGRLQWIDTFLFSSPSELIRALFEIDKNGSVIRHTGVTLYETIFSFLLTVFLSLMIAVLLWYCTTVSEILEPFLVALNSLPKSALAPLLIVWLGTGLKTIIIAGMSVAIFGSIINLYYSFRSSNEEYTRLIRTLGGNRYHILIKIILPGSIPVIISNMKVNIGLCLVGVIIGEFLAAREGLGYLIIYSTQIFRLDWLIMSILILCIIALSLYFLLHFFERIFRKY